MSIKELLKMFWAKLWDPGLGASVRKAARAYLNEFGYKGVREAFGGIQYTVDLEHCAISFSLYKMDLGCVIQPIACDQNSCYESIQVDEVPVWRKAVSLEVNRQMQVIVEKYRAILLGDFTDLPTCDKFDSSQVITWFQPSVEPRREEKEKES